jgi:hypothetical protein
VWKSPDWPEIVAGGVDPVAAALMKRMYDRLPVKPNYDAYHGMEDDTDALFIKVVKGDPRAIPARQNARRCEVDRAQDRGQGRLDR